MTKEIKEEGVYDTQYHHFDGSGKGREGKGMSNSGGLGSHMPGMGSGPWPLCTQALLPLHREGARGFLPQPGRFWRDGVPESLGQSRGQQITGAAGTRALPVPQGSGCDVGCPGSCAGSGTHLHQAG